MSSDELPSSNPMLRIMMRPLADSKVIQPLDAIDKDPAWDRELSPKLLACMQSDCQLYMSLHSKDRTTILLVCDFSVSQAQVPVLSHEGEDGPP